MDHELNEWCDNIDAAMFSGDKMYDNDTRERMQWYLNRWQKELNAVEDALADEEYSGH